MKEFSKIKSEYFLYFAWIVSIIGSLGSLVYSELLKLPPCSLCWYQRSMMYPLPLILMIGIIEKNKNIFKYAVGLTMTGMILALYQLALTAGILPHSIIMCLPGSSCAADYSKIFGFFSIPLQSFLGFFVITISLYIHYFLENTKAKNII
jgi:disulfide bond formation protein DsbB